MGKSSVKYTKIGRGIDVCSSYEPVYRRNEPPSKRDIAELEEVLRGFLINVDIPEFNTRADMESWRRSQIKKQLSL